MPAAPHRLLYSSGLMHLFYIYSQHETYPIKPTTGPFFVLSGCKGDINIASSGSQHYSLEVRHISSELEPNPARLKLECKVARPFWLPEK